MKTKLDELLALVDAKHLERAKKLVESVLGDATEMAKKIGSEEVEKNTALKAVRDSSDRVERLRVELGAAKEDDLVEKIQSLKKVESPKTAEKTNVDTLKEVEELKNQLKKISIESEAALAAQRDKLTLSMLGERVAGMTGELKIKKSALPYVIDQAKKSASVSNDGKILFKNDDGSTARDAKGKEIEVSEFLKNFRQAELDRGESVFFEADVKPSGAPTSAGTDVQPDFDLSAPFDSTFS